MGSDPEDPRPLHCPAEGKQRTKYRGVVLSVTATVKFTKCINDQEVRYCLASFNPTSVSVFAFLRGYVRHELLHCARLLSGLIYILFEYFTVLSDPGDWHGWTGPRSTI